MSRVDHQGIGMTSRRTRERLVQRLASQGIHNTAVLEAIASVPRHLFVDEALAHRAYEDTALPIGHGQTISQPFVVALMTQTLLNQPRGHVLEVGTGCGYQTAILAGLVTKVSSVERIEALSQRAGQQLRELKVRNVRMRHGDGYQGWAGQGPFDGIVVTAAPQQVPQALLDQLAPGGRMLVPVGGNGVQELKVFDRDESGELRVDTIDYVRFVPLVQGVASP
ncbi:MAG: protein-L-isoaspartate(D-aspartate) O-methyltransferase [Pseudomonadales bacterium]